MLNRGEISTLSALLNLRVGCCEQFHGVHYTYLSEFRAANFRKGQEIFESS